METTEIVIVGAGPSGLVLALLLAQYEVKSVVLEKELNIHEDPRGIVMTGDGVRTLNSMGLGQVLADVSQQHNSISFHLNSIKNAAYLRFPQNWDLLEQALPPVCFMGQPSLEKALRQAVDESSFCELRVGCEVVQRVEEADGVIVKYKQPAEESHKTDNSLSFQQIRARWLVGADGKTGVVRKYFLEPAGITQQVGKYAYTGTWIAANLEISLPTPQTHPDLPFWPLGLSPEEVYDIFWPKDWHFCTHPKEAVATGRFGPKEERLWRHEFELDCAWRDDMDALAVFWKNLTPNITHDGSSILGLSKPICYPRDCLKVLRCRPFTFVQKVAGPLWHHNRTIIIGDAAHVFPPFGGQGIASGVRDAVGLSWRLAILTKLQLKGGSATADSMLENWCRERRQGVDDSADITMTNGRLTAQKWRAMAYLQVAVGTVLCKIPWLLNMATKNVFRDDLGYSKAKDGFFLPHQRGGCKLSQIYVQRDSVGKPVLSDSIVRRACPLVTILIISTGKETPALVSKVKKIVRAAESNPLLVSDGSICVFDPANACEETGATRYSPCNLVELERHEVKFFPRYDENTFLRRLGTGTKFAVIRPDAIIFSLCKNIEELETALKEMKELIS